MAAGNRLTMRVVFAPTEEGPAETTWLIRTNPSTASTVLNVRGRAVSNTYVSPLCELPANLEFGSVVIGSTKTLQVPICNLSTDSLSIELIEGQNLRRCAAAGAGAPFCWRLSPAQVGPDGRFELAAGQTHTLSIEFSPAIAGTRERGSLRLRTCDNSACESELRTTGAGIESGLFCSPNLLAFGDVNPGECLTKSMLCENIGNIPVTISDWGNGDRIGLPTDDAFEFAPAAPRVLTEGEGFEIDVSFCPTALGNHSGSLYIDSDQPQPQLITSLTGQGGGPSIEVLPNQIDFGLVTTQAPARRNVLITNTGFDTLEITSVIVDALATGAFSAAGVLPIVINPGNSLTITIEFQPLVPGLVESELIITSNDLGTPRVVIPLRGEGISLPPCQYELSQAQLNFGHVRAQHSLQRLVGVRNLGASDCLITGVRLEPGSDWEFRLIDPPTLSLRLSPGELRLFALEFAPNGPSTNVGALELSLSSSTNPVARALLSGAGTDEGILMAPRHVDFGNPGVGCASPTRAVTLYNPSAQAATISAIEIESGPTGPFTIVRAPAPPTSILPGASLTVEVEFGGSSLGPRSDALRVSGSLNGVPFEYYAALNGEQLASGRQVERLDQLATGKVDLLFVVDNSGSLGNEQALLADAFPAVVQLARSEGIDYQVGLTTTDTDDEAGRLVHPREARSGAFSGSPGLRIITESTRPTAEAQFRFHAQASLLSGGGAQNEAGFWASYQATSSVLLRGHNTGFVRDDAALAVVFVSDEAEQSQLRIGAPSEFVDFYRDALLALKGPKARNRVTVSSIAGDDITGCTGHAGNAGPAPRYNQIARDTGGHSAPVCLSDWYAMMTDLSRPLLGLRSKFYLEKVPLPASVEVDVDGVQLPATSQTGAVNWRYEGSDNSVVFSPFVTPALGADITVRSTSICR